MDEIKENSAPAWNTVFVFAVVTLFCLCFFKPKPYWEILQIMPKGLMITVGVTFMSMLCTILIGLIVGLGRISKNRVINLIASIYVETIRGIPLLVQLFYIYYAMAEFFSVDQMTAAVIAISVCYGAYMGENFRAGIISIPKGQSEAAAALGFSKVQTFFYIILPQAWRIILPPAANDFISMLKDTSLISVLAVPEILRRGDEYASENFAYFEAYTIIALIYLILTLLLSKAAFLLERKVSVNDDDE